MKAMKAITAVTLFILTLILICSACLAVYAEPVTVTEEAVVVWSWEGLNRVHLADGNEYDFFGDVPFGALVNVTFSESMEVLDVEVLDVLTLVEVVRWIEN